MKNNNIRRCYYINIDGKLTYENVNDMISTQISCYYLTQYNKIYKKNYTKNEFTQILFNKFKSYSQNALINYISNNT